ncbi:MAG: hypothetical protein UT86_C0004G0028 [Candidatus Magasanikbacteria bacterium GW2011_GWC2_40_17]|uniref:Uncharacterized protein n=1 Tax=Candidatus Magasanikbacteria bacterium GW2011_GWA2_42_32 TaxID=1619039 RepID=A0A0G1D500_9BACT|nr:MAG: hypothetical protein UT86_C0004G0028 [Candidatus Magasanikbacteria bacterium GW2011_GWC2_40_17]KKS57088.1 MAG: hypothetical protein UV20_C0003G0028 [Candidatus Magasanikbacteria bacterium GW2011_GWA2_42_32]
MGRQDDPASPVDVAVKPSSVLQELERGAPVLGATILGRVGLATHHRLVGAVAHDDEAVGVQTQLDDQVVGAGTCAIIRQLLVHLPRTLAVRVALDQDARFSELLGTVDEERIDGLLAPVRQVGGVEGEVDREVQGRERRSLGVFGLGRREARGLLGGVLRRTGELRARRHEGRVHDVAPERDVVGRQADLVEEAVHLVVHLLAAHGTGRRLEAEEQQVVTVGGDARVLDHASGRGHVVQVETRADDLRRLRLGRRHGIDLARRLEPSASKLPEGRVLRDKHILLGQEDVGDGLVGLLGVDQHLGAEHVLHAVLVIRGPDHCRIRGAGLVAAGRLDAVVHAHHLDVRVGKVAGGQGQQEEGVARRTDGHRHLLALEVADRVDPGLHHHGVAALAPVGLDELLGTKRRELRDLRRQRVGGGQAKHVALASLPRVAHGLEVVDDLEAHDHAVLVKAARVVRGRLEPAIVEGSRGVAAPRVDAHGQDGELLLRHRRLDLLDLDGVLLVDLADPAHLLGTEVAAVEAGRDEHQDEQPHHGLEGTSARHDLFFSLSDPGLTAPSP